MLPFYKQFPALQQHLPHIPLGPFPTPVNKLSGLCSLLHTDNLFIKCDDASGPLYGGNKVRKLEFLLAQAKTQGAKTVITMGGTGSNHALATALYARHLGFRCTLLLSDQPVSRGVRTNLVMDMHAGAEIRHFTSFIKLHEAVPSVVSEITARDKHEPLLIPTGGTNPVGTTGFVNAGLELAGQIKAGELPEPDVIYAAFGSMGTVVGLALGLRAAGLKTKIAGIRVVPAVVGSEEKARALFIETDELLHRYDPAFPMMSYESAGVTIDHDWFGREYGLFTRESVDAVTAIKETEGITLDGVYTGKACAAFIAYAKAKPKNEVALFWNTKSSVAFPAEALVQDYHRLPESLHRYFIEDVQELDR